MAVLFAVHLCGSRFGNKERVPRKYAQALCYLEKGFILLLVILTLVALARVPQARATGSGGSYSRPMQSSLHFGIRGGYVPYPGSPKFNQLGDPHSFPNRRTTYTNIHKAGLVQTGCSSRLLLTAQAPAPRSYIQFSTLGWDWVPYRFAQTSGKKSKHTQVPYEQRGLIVQVLDSYGGGAVGFAVGFLAGALVSRTLLSNDTGSAGSPPFHLPSVIVGGMLGEMLGSSTLLYYKNHRRIPWLNLFLGTATPVVVGMGFSVAVDSPKPAISGVVLSPAGTVAAWYLMLKK